MKFLHTLLLLACFSLALAHDLPAAPLDITPSVEHVTQYPAGLPIPTGPDTPSHKDFVPTYATWADRMIVGEYRRLHPEDTSVADFLSDTAQYLWRATEEVRKPLSSRGEELERMGITDPAFQMMAGIVQKETAKKEKILRLAMAGFPKTDYSRFLLFMAATNLGRSLQERKAAPREIAEVDRIALEALAAGLNLQSFRENEMAALRWRLCSETTESLLRRRGSQVAEIFERATNLPDWIREFGQGRSYLREAWIARTGGWIHDVTEEGWAGWQRNLVKAREHLTKAWELNPKDPAAAAYMIEVTMGDGGEKREMRLWFDRSVAAEMDCWQAYRSLMWALRPRWGGSHEEMLQFGDECLRTGRFDTCIPYYYLMTVDEISEEDQDHKAIYERPEISRNFRLGLDRYLQTPDTPLSSTYAHTTAAILDYRNGNLAGARTHLAAIQFQINREVGAGLLEDLPKMMAAISVP